MTTKSKTDVMAGVEPIAKAVRGGFGKWWATAIDKLSGADNVAFGEHLLYTSAQINKQFAKAMAEKNVLLTEMQRELDEATEYRNKLRQQLAEAQAREQELNTDQWWYKELENAANSFDVSIDFRRAVFGVLCSYMDRARNQSRDALESAIAAVIEPYKRDAERYKWLRAQHWSESEFCVVRHPKNAARLGSRCPSDANLDAEIDKAIASQKEQT